jgi:hypothetical protein
MYSGEYDACDVTLSVYPHQASLKNMPGHGGKYSISTTVGSYSKGRGSIPTVVRHIFQACPVWIYTQSLRVTSQASYSPEYITPTQKKS